MRRLGLEPDVEGLTAGFACWEAETIAAESART